MENITYHNQYVNLDEISQSYLLSYNFSIIPLKSETKEAAVKWKPYQLNRAKLSDVQSWFDTDFNFYNIGIVTGKVSENLVVLDFDRPGMFDKYAAAHADIVNNTAISQSSEDYKKHIYLRTEKIVPPNYSKAMFRGERIGETRAEGGYIVAPPSIHPTTKKSYRWLQSPHDYPILVIPNLDEIEIVNGVKEKRPNLPDSQVRFVYNNDVYCHAALERAAQSLSKETEGNRHCHYLTAIKNLAKYVRSGGLTRKEIEEKMKPIGLKIGLDNYDVERTFIDSMRFGEGSPYIMMSARENYQKFAEISKPLGLFYYLKNHVCRETGLKVDQETGEVLTCEVYNGLDKYYVQGHLPVSINENKLAEVFGVNRTTINDWIQKLKKDCFLRYLGRADSNTLIYAVGEIRRYGELEYEYFFDMTDIYDEKGETA